MTKRYRITYLAAVYAHQHRLSQSTIYQKMCYWAGRKKKPRPYQLSYRESLDALYSKQSKWKQYPPKLPDVVSICPHCRKEAMLNFSDGYSICLKCHTSLNVFDAILLI